MNLFSFSLACTFIFKCIKQSLNETPKDMHFIPKLFVYEMNALYYNCIIRRTMT